MKISIFCIFFILSNSWSLEAKKLVVALDSHFIGEKVFAYRILQAAKNLNIQAAIYDFLNPDDTLLVDPDIVVNLTPNFLCKGPYRRYLAVFLPNNNFLDSKGNYLFQYSDYEGYLLTFDPDEYRYLTEFYNPFDGKPYINWYPTCPKINIEPKGHKTIFWITANWGKRLESKSFADFTKLLMASENADVYGRSCLDVKTKGLIPFGDDELYKISSSSGISLIIHSDQHNLFGIPSGRIFEAAAVGNIIICDQNPFVKKFFQDTVLYFQPCDNPVEMASRIFSVYDFIKKNQTIAKAMAERSHQIFIDHFLLENQILKLLEFDSQLEIKEKNF